MYKKIFCLLASSVMSVSLYAGEENKTEKFGFTIKKEVEQSELIYKQNHIIDNNNQNGLILVYEKFVESITSKQNQNGEINTKRSYTEDFWCQNNPNGRQYKGDAMKEECSKLFTKFKKDLEAHPEQAENL